MKITRAQLRKLIREAAEEFKVSDEDIENWEKSAFSGLGDSDEKATKPGVASAMRGEKPKVTSKLDILQKSAAEDIKAKGETEKQEKAAKKKTAKENAVKAMKLLADALEKQGLLDQFLDMVREKEVVTIDDPEPNLRPPFDKAAREEWQERQKEYKTLSLDQIRSKYPKYVKTQLIKKSQVWDYDALKQIAEKNPLFSKVKSEILQAINAVVEEGKSDPSKCVVFYLKGTEPEDKRPLIRFADAIEELSVKSIDEFLNDYVVEARIRKMLKNLIKEVLTSRN